MPGQLKERKLDYEKREKDPNIRRDKLRISSDFPNLMVTLRPRGESGRRSF